MAQIIFAFTFNPDTQEAAIAGNVAPLLALQILQSIVINAAQQQGKSDNGDKKAADELEKPKEKSKK